MASDINTKFSQNLEKVSEDIRLNEPTMDEPIVQEPVPEEAEIESSSEMIGKLLSKMDRRLQNASNSVSSLAARQYGDTNYLDNANRAINDCHGILNSLSKHLRTFAVL